MHFRRQCLARAGGQPFVYAIDGFRFVCTPGISDSEEVYLTAEADVLEFNVLRKWLEAGDTFVDVGTNLGLYSFCVHQHLQGRGRIISIEASPKLVANLKVAAGLLELDGIRFEGAAVGVSKKRSFSMRRRPVVRPVCSPFCQRRNELRLTHRRKFK